MPKIIQSILTLIYAFVPAMVILNLLGVTLITSFAMMEIIAMGIDVPSSVWLATISRDLVHLSPLYSAIFGIGLVISLIAAAFSAKFLPFNRSLIDVTAGIVSAITALMLMNNLLGVTPIGASRTITGLLALSACSGIAALTFSFIRRKITS
jgi:hypothetical protein